MNLVPKEKIIKFHYQRVTMTHSKIFFKIKPELIILENFNKEIIGTLQLTFIQYLTYRGGLRAQIEAVRIQRKFRGKGFGKGYLNGQLKEV